ncbi:MAG TPA: glycosyltransferase family 4 protein [Acetobacteraceae bacterium]|jgi:glycosyltransferase involved in cell wall biosynthesis|nr:glycosyltransferase family 4 protein [Acetobacteraceae bacterium]
MRLLFCCEYYHPSRGGVQEVMRQIAERMAAAGHDVTVATTRLKERSFTTLNGVRIEEFDIAGNRASGMRGELEKYREFLRSFDGDAVLIKAAQQWTFDAAWDVLDAMRPRKVFIPCGFSCLYEPDYAAYYEQMPAILAKFDRLIFYAEDYRDVAFARQHGLTHLSFLPNGASDVEFAERPPPGIRARLGIPEDALVIMTIGTPINAKGHTELAQAFCQLDSQNRKLALILNGRWPTPAPPPPPPVPEEPVSEEEEEESPPPPEIEIEIEPKRNVADIGQRALSTLMQDGFVTFLGRTALWLRYRSQWLLGSILSPFIRAGAWTIYGVRLALYRAKGEPEDIPEPEPPPPAPKTIDDWIAEAEAQPGKQVLRLNLPRRELVETMFAADLFVFASNVEYSPLVLFEACAAGLPFLTVPVGNSEEIVRWTGGGVVCPAPKDERGYTRVDPAVLAPHIERLLADVAMRRALGGAGRAAWQKTYSWSRIAPRYEAILRGDGGVC